MTTEVKRDALVAPLRAVIELARVQRDAAEVELAPLEILDPGRGDLGAGLLFVVDG